MYLLLVAVVLAAAGVAMMRYGIPIEEMSSVALFVSGIVALVGALVIGALAVVARSLGRIAERLEIQPLPPPPAAPAVRPPTKPAAAQNGAANTVYRSGVIDGMAYTLFMDGSIQAELPQGAVKFSNIDDLQKYLLGNR